MDLVLLICTSEMREQAITFQKFDNEETLNVLQLKGKKILR